MAFSPHLEGQLPLSSSSDVETKELLSRNVVAEAAPTRAAVTDAEDELN